MPSMAVHLAVGKEFLKHNKVKDKKSFRKGILEPDMLGLLSQEAKEKAHYTDPRTDNMTLQQRFGTKVNLLKYVQERNINSDFELGYYVHLVTDYYFFNQFLFFPKCKVENEDYENLKELYNDYEKIARDMETLFGVDNSDTPWFGLYQEGEPTLFTKQEICEFVKKCANVNVFKLREKILNDPQNWRVVAKNFYK